MENKVIKGQAWVFEDKMLQEQILILPNAVSNTNTIIIIEDIWKDLLLSTEDSIYKTNGKGYFYWEYKMTDVSNPDVEVTILLECPKPKEGLFKEPYDPDTVTGEYAKYWTAKLKTATENYEKAAAIQKKEITLKGSTYVDQNGTQIKVEDINISNSDLGDLTNLLTLF